MGSSGASKVVNTETMGNYCSLCVIMRKKLSGEDFILRQISYQPICVKNHNGSAGQMEGVGMDRIFKRSETDRGLKYSGYLRDGDSKSYTIVSSADPRIAKLECCGQAQKRMGKRLMDKVAENKGKVFVEKRQSAESKDIMVGRFGTMLETRLQ